MIVECGRAVSKEGYKVKARAPAGLDSGEGRTERRETTNRKERPEAWEHDRENA